MKRILKLFRSALTGRFVSRTYAAEHPAETVAETRWVDEERVRDGR